MADDRARPEHEIREDKNAVTKGLSDETNMRQLSSSGWEAKRARDENKAKKDMQKAQQTQTGGDGQASGGTNEYGTDTKRK
ncbi:MAG: hypothetical protein M1837_002229 [Sclerophora amabilis]|nr:MAG: hypothetical protein M1837_002229 [Sclerophora amabilis]